MDIVSDSRAVGRGIIVAANIKVVKLADGNLSYIRHKVCGYSVGVFAYSAALVGANGVEITQQANAPLVVGGIGVFKNPFNIKLCGAVRIGCLSLGHIFSER